MPYFLSMLVGLKQFPLAALLAFFSLSTFAVSEKPNFVVPPAADQPKNKKTWHFSSRWTKKASELLRSSDDRNIRRAEVLLQRAVLLEPANARARVLLARIANGKVCRQLLQTVGMKEAEPCIDDLATDVCPSSGEDSEQGTEQETEGKEEEKPKTADTQAQGAKISENDKMCEYRFYKFIIQYPLHGLMPSSQIKIGTLLRGFPNGAYAPYEHPDSDQDREAAEKKFMKMLRRIFRPGHKMAMTVTGDTAIQPSFSHTSHLDSARAGRIFFDLDYDVRVDGLLTCDELCCSLLRERSQGDTQHYLDEICFTSATVLRPTSIAWHAFNGSGN